MEGRFEPAFRQKYVRRLLAELRRRRIERGASVSVRARAVKAAADLSMAMAARGRSGWSRAILLARSRQILSFHAKVKKMCSQEWKPLKFRKSSRRLSGLRRLNADACFSCEKKCRRTSPRSHCKEAGGVLSRMGTLRALVPGGRGLDAPVLLKEVADYISALQMQVESMRALADELENFSAASASSCPR